MEGIAHLVSASLDRHGFATQVDHRRLEWSPWLRCESSVSVLLLPSKPGLLMLAEEHGADQGFVSGHRFSDAVTIVPEAPLGAEGPPLTLPQILQVEDLGMALARLLLPTAPKARYVRYAVLEDEDQRHSSHRALQEWMASSSESKSELIANLTVHNFATDEDEKEEIAEESLPLLRTGTSG